MVPHREVWKSLCVLGRSCDISDSKSAINLRAVVVVSAPKKRYTQDLFLNIDVCGFALFCQYECLCFVTLSQFFPIIE